MDYYFISKSFQLVEQEWLWAVASFGTGSNQVIGNFYLSSLVPIRMTKKRALMTYLKTDSKSKKKVARNSPFAKYFQVTDECSSIWNRFLLYLFSSKQTTRIPKYKDIVLHIKR